jgi:hypothetical protein
VVDGRTGDAAVELGLGNQVGHEIARGSHRPATDRFPNHRNVFEATATYPPNRTTTKAASSSNPIIPQEQVHMQPRTNRHDHECFACTQPASVRRKA